MAIKKVKTSKVTTAKRSTGRIVKSPILRKPSISPGLIAIVSGVLILVGGLYVLLSRASGNEKVVLEAEQANSKVSSSNITDGTASGGLAVNMASAGTGIGGWPTADSYKVCGNTAMLSGPTSAPSGSVTINPGTDLATATSNASAGTTFYLTAGTHTLPNAPINPKTGNTYIGAPGAVLDGQFKTNYTSGSRTMSMAFKGSTGYSNVTIKYLTIKNFGQSDGKMSSMVNQTAINWGQSPSWTVANNTISYNGGSGIWLADNSKLQNNCIEYNEQMGFAVPSIGGGDYHQRSNILVEGNEIRYNNRSNAIESLGVCTGCAGGLKIWNSKAVTIRNNNVNNNNGTGIWVDNNNIDILVEGNVSKNNTKRGIFYEISYSGIIRKNYVTGNYVNLKGGANNPAVYISEAGGDEATKTYLGGTFPAELNINNNYIVDNWNGVTLWEDAGRYCTQNDTSWCPPLIMGNNDTDKNANISKCSTYLSSNADVCRWKTKNVKVQNNKIEMTSASTWCTTSNASCALNSIIANTGPSGTPYSGSAIQEAITKNQNNTFSGNQYVGNTKFNVYSSGNAASQSVWQSSWGQDANSTFSTTGTQSCATTNSGASELTYNSIQLQGGSYKVWARIKSSAGGRVRVIVNNSQCTDIAASSGVTDWQWGVSSQVISSLLSGTYSMRIVALDPNVSIDKLLILDTSVTCTPTGDGTNCTSTPSPTPTTTTTTTSTVTPTTTVTPAPTTTTTVSPSPTPTTTTTVTTTPTTTTTVSPSPTTTTTPPPTTDTTAPSTPTNVKASVVFDALRFSYYNSLRWTASYDNVGVSRYLIKRNGTQIGTSTTTKFQDYNIAANTPYSYEIYAQDAAGNTSQAGAARLVGKCFLIWCWAE
jgi:parallel beta-helix repeat protein